jgi:hypothetical protein
VLLHRSRPLLLLPRRCWKAAAAVAAAAVAAAAARPARLLLVLRSLQKGPNSAASCSTAASSQQGCLQERGYTRQDNSRLTLYSISKYRQAPAVREQHQQLLQQGRANSISTHKRAATPVTLHMVVCAMSMAALTDCMQHSQAQCSSN